MRVTWRERFEMPPPTAHTIVPVPLRADLTIFIQGLPLDLSQAEAEKISAVIMALATPAENYGDKE